MARDKQKRYWKGTEERDRSEAWESEAQKEFPVPLTGKLDEDASKFSRRSFLKAAGFSAAGTILASCAREPVERAIPMLVQEENMMPGKAYWYASTCGGCQAGCGILTKNRDGRPVKIEGNAQHPVSMGGLCAVGQATVLGLYDSHRLRQPKINGTPSNWAVVDEQIRAGLADNRDGVYVLTGTITSPSTQAAIDNFLSDYDDGRHIVYDAVSYSAIQDAHNITHGVRILPHYKFNEASVIVSVEADFLGTWLSPVEFTKGYVAGRTLEGDSPKLSHHVQFEGRMSLSGSNADRRVPIATGESITILRNLAERLSNRAEQNVPQLAGLSGTTGVGSDILDDVANRLWEARGESLVVCGLNDTATQCVVNTINQILGNYGKTVETDKVSNQWQSDDSAVDGFLADLRNGRVKALITADTNPAYSLPDAGEFSQLMSNVPLSITFTDHDDETSQLAGYVCPLHHPLEAWGDAEPMSGVLSVSQPTIRPLGQTRSLRESLVSWTTGEAQDDLALVRNNWRQNIFTRQSAVKDFDAFWDQAVHDGFIAVDTVSRQSSRYRAGGDWPESVTTAASGDRYTLVLYEKIGQRDGRHAHNPWLQELPDPISKVVWDNYVALAPSVATSLGLEEGDHVRVSGDGVDVELPIQIQMGQHPRVLSIALGYGRAGTDRFSNVGPDWFEREDTVAVGGTVGENSFGFGSQQASGNLLTAAVTITAVEGHSNLTLTQTHHTITVPEHLGGERRNMVRDTTLAAYTNDQGSGNHAEHEVLQLWADDYPYTGHHWGLAIDLNRCTGCSACSVACQAENNVPVVGRDEVYRRREMHWIRIDRYYSGTDENVDVMFQPVMCQHCDHAPCEAVCPVLATVHSDEGVNQQIYNRCVGTRYCANNCPYKVRRFNWFDYWTENSMEHLALNPDITTRTRGVMEKCSLCVQRVQEARSVAKLEDRSIADGDILTACQQSCPADAIVFGDMNDADSRVSRLIAQPRHYRMLEEMNYRPTVGYMTKVRHREDEESAHS